MRKRIGCCADAECAELLGVWSGNEIGVHLAVCVEGRDGGCRVGCCLKEFSST